MHGEAMNMHVYVYADVMNVHMQYAIAYFECIKFCKSMPILNVSSFVKATIVYPLTIPRCVDFS